jgi:hypothetical protein
VEIILRVNAFHKVFWYGQVIEIVLPEKFWFGQENIFCCYYCFGVEGFFVLFCLFVCLPEILYLLVSVPSVEIFNVILCYVLFPVSFFAS